MTQGFSPPPDSPSSIRGYSGLNADYLAWLAKRAPPAATQSSTALVIDPVNGKDNQSGFTAASAIKTNAEANKRLAGYSIDHNVTVTWTSYPAISTDPLRLDLNVVKGSSSSPLVTFQGPALTQLLSGTVAATTPRNRATNTPNQITQASLAAAHVSLRGRVTGGSRVNSRFWFAKDLGGGALRISEPAIADLTPSTGQFLTPTVLQNGDPFEVLQSTGTMMVDYVNVISSGGFYGGSQPLVYFLDLDLAPWTAASAVPFFNRACAIDMHNCRFTNVFPGLVGGGTGGFDFRSESSAANAQTWTSLLNCCALNKAVVFSGYRAIADSVDAGLYTQVFAGGSNYLSILNDVLFQDPISGGTLAAAIGAIDGGTLLVDAVGIMDHRVTSFSGMIVRDGGRLIFTPSFYGLGGYGWGTSASAVYGMEVSDDGTMRYRNAALLSVTGASGDFRVGARTSVEPFDLATRTYLAAVACTWANLAASATSKDNLHDVTHNARVYKSTAQHF
jgi:hypothetical protein